MENIYNLSENIVGINFESRIEKKDINNLRDILNDRIEKFGKVCLIIEDSKNESISMGALIKDFALEFTNHSKVQKIAIVSDDTWFRIIANIKSVFTSTSVESFKRKDRLEALEWIMN